MYKKTRKNTTNSNKNGSRVRREEEKLEEMNLPTLEERKKRGELIAVYKLLSGMDKTDMNILSKEEAAYTRRNLKKKGRCLNNTKKYSFPHRSIHA